MFKSIRSRIIVSFVILNLITALPISWLFYDALKSVVAISFDVETGSALSDALHLSAELLDGYKKRCLERTRALNESPLMKSVFRRDPIRLDFAQESLDPKRWSFDAIMVLNKGGTVLLQKSADIIPMNVELSLRDSSYIQTIMATTEAVADYDESYGVIRATMPILAGTNATARLVTAWAIPRDLRARFDNTLRVRRLYENLQNQKDNLITSFLKSFFLVYGAILAFTLVVAFGMSALVSRPIGDLLLATERFSQGDLDYRLAPKLRNDEIGQLVTSFNTMIEQIKRHQDRLVYLEKLTAWREIAQRMAHEIKNPLTPIRLNIQQLKDSYKGADPTFRELLDASYEIICEEVDNLRHLTKEFSDFARLPQITRTFGQINEVVTDVVKLYPAISLVTRLDPNIGSFEFDRDAMKRVLINLIDNARAAVSGCSNPLIEIRTFEADTWAHIVVQDNGCGIPKAYLPRIFEPHFSGQSTGMGLGLAIAKAIIDEHCGALDVESVENQGTIFHLVLPMSLPILFDQFTNG